MADFTSFASNPLTPIMTTCIAIDDDPLFLKLLEVYFDEIFDAVLISSWENPVKGALAIAKQNPDVVLLDYDMPYMDGFQMLDSLQTIPKIILISGHIIEPNHDTNFDLFLPKSQLTSPDVLKRFVSEVIKTPDRTPDN
ncbi:MAG: CheY-like chemotaxis protein [Cyclobacteriaceae bacterium]